MLTPNVETHPIADTHSNADTHPTVTTEPTDLATRIKTRQAHVVVIGLGYVGLPIAVEFNRQGFRVTGYDKDAAKTQGLWNGESYVEDISDEDVQACLSTGKFGASDSPEVIHDADVVIIAVPTPLNKTKDPDISYILEATEDVAEHPKADRLVVLESTTYPGTTMEVVLPRLEMSCGKVGEDFFLAFSPERIDPGNQAYTFATTPKVVGGVTPTCTRLAGDLYAKVCSRVVPVSSPGAAEMVKLLENTFRSVNIGLVNEIAIMCSKLGVDTWEVIEAAATKPFGFMPFYPGPGLGGHCIPIDPHYLAWKLKTLNYRARFIELAGEVNSSMPQYVAEKAADILNRFGKAVQGSDVLLIGMAYKPDISDLRESPALDVVKLLSEKGATIRYHDPFVPFMRTNDTVVKGRELTQDEVRSADLVIILTNHTDVDYDMLFQHARAVLDTRGVQRGIRDPKRIFRL